MHEQGQVTRNVTNVREYVTYLRVEKGVRPATSEAYKRDVEQFAEHLEGSDGVLTGARQECRDGSLPVTFPHRRGWHTDQSFRRPPPDISLLYAVQIAVKGQGQTLFADCTAAFDALSSSAKARIECLFGIHTGFGAGRSEEDVRNQRPVPALMRHERPQLQPLIRLHPVTGLRALYLSDGGQMDWVDGPFAGMSAGLNGDGAKLLYELMEHLTQREFVYVHEWDRGDMVIFDNRNLVHSVAWFDAARYQRTLWRTTVNGNPGKQYDGEKPSWIPDADDQST